MTARPRIGWVVDVQHDFMDPPALGGRLYVRHLDDPADHGAVEIVPVLARSVRWLGAHCSTVIYTADWHTDDDREIDRAAPNFRDTFPAHCMGAGQDATERGGAELLDVLRPGTMVAIDRDASGGDADHAAEAAASGRPVIIRKREFSVFTGQRRTERFLSALGRELGAMPEVIVCGVATDVCVRLAVEGFLDRGYAVTVIRDAVRGLGIIPDEELFAAWQERGARIATIAELERATTAATPQSRIAPTAGAGR